MKPHAFGFKYAVGYFKTLLPGWPYKAGRRCKIAPGRSYG